MILRALDKTGAGAHSGNAGELQSAVRQVLRGEDGAHYTCGACRAFVTARDARVEIEGSHEHIRNNPSGIVFQIGCFANAPGCIGVGEASAHFTWFAGHTWQVALCRRCYAHLGWQFRGRGAGFFGLILNRILLENERGDQR